MRRSNAAVAAVVTALVMVGLAAPGVSAAEVPDPMAPTSGVVSGREFGPEEGFQVTKETFNVVSGEGPIEIIYGAAPAPGVITPFANWGSSYATSTEYLQLYYVGKAKAAGNVWNGQRIVKVCISYSHPGRSSPTVCSSASSTGSSWTAGSESSVTFMDNLSVNWPQTSFNVTVTRINPNVY